MDLIRLRHLKALASTLHFHKAAELCHVSPSTLSRSIQALEEELGSTLFDRYNRAVSITQDGEKALKYANDVLEKLEHLKEDLRTEPGELRGSLSLYCSVTASYSFLHDILSDFRQEHPRVEMIIHTGDPALAIERVAQTHEDIAIAAKLDHMPADVHFKLVAKSPLILIRPNQSKWDNIPMSTKWVDLPFFLSEKGVARERLNAWFSTHGITPNIYAQVAGHEAIVSMVSLGFGLGLVPEIVLNNSPLKHLVSRFKRQPKLAPYEVGLCVLERRLKNPVVRAFWELLRQTDS